MREENHPIANRAQGSETLTMWTPAHEEPLPRLPLVILHLDADGEHFAAADGIFHKGQWFDLTEWLGHEELGGGVEAIDPPLYWAYLPPRLVKEQSAL